MTLFRQNALLALCLLAGVAVSISLGKAHQPRSVPNRWSKNPNFPAQVPIRRPLSAPVQKVSFHGIQVGMTPAEVDARLGPPQRVEGSPNRRVYFAPGQLNLTVEFFNNRARYLEGTQIESDQGEAIFVWVEQGRELFLGQEHFDFRELEQSLGTPEYAKIAYLGPNSCDPTKKTYRNVELCYPNLGWLQIALCPYPDWPQDRPIPAGKPKEEVLAYLRPLQVTVCPGVHALEPLKR